MKKQIQQEQYTGKGGIYSTRKLELACRKNIDVIWLLQGEKVPDYSSFDRFRSGKAFEGMLFCNSPFSRYLFFALPPQLLPDGTELLRHIRIGHSTGDIYRPGGFGSLVEPAFILHGLQRVL